jgi:hypothetical protein
MPQLRYLGTTVTNQILIQATGLRAEGSEFESWKGQEFPLLHIVQAGSGPTGLPVQWVLGVKLITPRTNAKVNET